MLVSVTNIGLPRPTGPQGAPGLEASRDEGENWTLLIFENPIPHAQDTGALVPLGREEESKTTFLLMGHAPCKCAHPLAKSMGIC